jgi:hypothetical protein
MLANKSSHIPSHVQGSLGGDSSAAERPAAAAATAARRARAHVHDMLFGDNSDFPLDDPLVSFLVILLLAHGIPHCACHGGWRRSMRALVAKWWCVRRRVSGDGGR